MIFTKTFQKKLLGEKFTVLHDTYRSSDINPLRGWIVIKATLHLDVNECCGRPVYTPVIIFIIWPAQIVISKTTSFLINWERAVVG